MRQIQSQSIIYSDKSLEARNIDVTLSLLSSQELCGLLQHQDEVVQTLKAPVYRKMEALKSLKTE